ncbi:CU044_2847 family protein [Kitasatospora sp. NPDC059803]|uniref:CU044_2847 family protein n=1 Tax=Kitasatospora sp. NPDC059803 TaxID=3346953 RepID=UPI003654CA99
MTELLRFQGPQGSSLVVEVEEDSPGIELVSRTNEGIAEAAHQLDEALTASRPTIESVLNSLRHLKPEQIEVSFGIKLNAEAGVVIAKTAAEGHFDVTLSWRTTGPAAED